MKNLKKDWLSALLLPAGILTVLSLVACEGGKKTESTPFANGIATQQEVAEESLSDGSSETTRKLAVTIAVSGLTYEDLEIHLEDTGADYTYDNKPFGTVKVSIDDLPASVAELKNLRLPDGMTDIHQSPYLQPLLLVAALNQLNYDKNEARAMIDYIVKGTKSENRDAKLYHFPNADESFTEAYSSEWNQAQQYKKYDKVRAWLDGANYANNYTPEVKPYTMTLELNNYSYSVDWDNVRLLVKNTQLSSPRYVGIWEYDSDNDGRFDTFWTSSFINMLHSVAEY